MIRAVIVLCLMASPIHAQPAQCAERAGVVEALKAKYGEVQVMMGKQDGGSDAIVEIFSNPITGTWTVLRSNMAGVTCLLASGTNLVAIGIGKPA